MIGIRRKDTMSKYDRFMFCWCTFFVFWAIFWLAHDGFDWIQTMTLVLNVFVSYLIYIENSTYIKRKFTNCKIIIVYTIKRLVSKL
jgi:hypothetical protein